MVFQQNLLENASFIAKMPGLAMVRPASSDLWKAPLVSPCGHVSSRWISMFATVVLRWHLSQNTTLKMHSSACLSWSFLFTLVLHWPFSHLISSSGHLWFASCSILPSNWQRSHFASKFSTSFLTVKLVFSSLDIGVRQLGQCFATPWYCTRTRQSLQYVWPHSGIIAGKISVGDCKHKIERYFQLWGLTIIFDTTLISYQIWHWKSGGVSCTGVMCSIFFSARSLLRVLRLK